MRDRRFRVALFVSSLDPGGAESLVVDLARRLTLTGMDVEVWHFGNEWLREALEAGRLQSVELEERYFKKSYWLFNFAWYLAKVLERRQIDVLHSHLFGAVIGAALPAAIARVRHIGTLHDRYSLLERRTRVALLRIASLLGTRLVAVSEEIHSEITKRSVMPWPRLRTVHNGIDTVGYFASTRQGSTNVTFVCVARLVPLKCIDVLIRAVAAVRAKYRYGIELLVAGDGPEREPLQRLIEQLEVAQSVRLLGFRDDVPELLAHADCFVLASNTEGLSVSILESMAAGIPAIATNVGGNSELIVNGETGILVALDDADALEAAVARTAEDAEWRRAAGERARARALEHFSARGMLDAYLGLYSEDGGDGR